MMAGAALGALIVILLIALVMVLGVNKGLRNSVDPLAKMAADYKTQSETLKVKVEALTKENAALQKPFIIGITNEQIHSLAMQINNIRDTESVTVH